MKQLAEYLVVDGYNIINAWPELKQIAEDSLEDARIKLIDCLRDYQGYKGIYVIIVFDAHMAGSPLKHWERYGDLTVVYTSKVETADHFIEKWVNDNSEKHNIRVATSDYLEQTIILGKGATRISARELREEVRSSKRERDRIYLQKPKIKINTLDNRLEPGILEKLERLRRER